MGKESRFPQSSHIYWGGGGGEQPNPPAFAREGVYEINVDPNDCSCPGAVGAEGGGRKGLVGNYFFSPPKKSRGLETAETLRGITAGRRATLHRELRAVKLERKIRNKTLRRVGERVIKETEQSPSARRCHQEGEAVLGEKWGYLGVFCSFYPRGRGVPGVRALGPPCDTPGQHQGENEVTSGETAAKEGALSSHGLACFARVLMALHGLIPAGTASHCRASFHKHTRACTSVHGLARAHVGMQKPSHW